jgi:hypothetical protein
MASASSSRPASEPTASGFEAEVEALYTDGITACKGA